MRITPRQHKAIKTAVLELAGSEVAVRLFGSRLDDEQRGGEIIGVRFQLIDLNLRMLLKYFSLCLLLPLAACSVLPPSGKQADAGVGAKREATAVGLYHSF